MNPAGSTPSVNNNGQNGDDTHWGMIRVPFALVLQACLMTLGIKWRGGTHQLFSSSQAEVKASTASVPRAQNLEFKSSI